MIDDKDIEQLVQDYIGDDDIGDDLGDILDGFGRYLRDKILSKGAYEGDDLERAAEKYEHNRAYENEMERYANYLEGLEEDETPRMKEPSPDTEYILNADMIDSFIAGAQWMESKMIGDYRWMTPHKTKIIQKSWYLEGWHDHKYNQKPQFEPGPDLEQKYRPCHMTGDEVQELCNRNYENGKKDKEEEIMKDAIHCKVFWHDGPLLDYTQEQQDDALEKIGAEVGDKVKLIIVKDNE